MEMLTYLKVTRDFINTSTPVPEHIRTPYDLLIEHGKAFEIGPHTYTGKRGEPKLCYMNAGRLALDDWNMVYVEGKITVFGVPIDHAWNVHRVTGDMVDVTLTGEVTRAANYFGVPFKTAYLRKTIMRTGVWGLIGHWNRPLFDRKLKSMDFVEERVISK